MILAINKELLFRNVSKINESYSSSLDEENIKTNNKKKNIMNNNITNLFAFYNPDCNFTELLKLNKNIKCPE